jgi:large subunit ribosomal protein L16
MLFKNKNIKPRNYINYPSYVCVSLKSLDVRDKLKSLVFSQSQEIASFSVFADEAGLIYDYQIEACKRLVKRLAKKIGRFSPHIVAYNAYTQKPSEVRMGKGKGKIEGYLVPVTSGQLLFSFDYVPFKLGKDVVRAVSFKLPVRVSIRTTSCIS